MEDNRDLGDGELRLALLRNEPHRPRLVLCGHVHDRNDWHARLGNALCLNPGYAMAPNCAPAHIVIDTTAGTSTWRAPALDAEESISLKICA
jgi:predicted phosphodiesterase